MLLPCCLLGVIKLIQVIDHHYYVLFVVSGLLEIFHLNIGQIIKLSAHLIVPTDLSLLHSCPHSVFWISQD